MSSLLLILTVVACYAILRSMGGHGATISISLDPANTRKGKIQRAKAGFVILIVLTSIFLIPNVGATSESTNLFEDIEYVFLGVLVVGLVYFMRKRNDKR
jgi:hypothetical protein